MGVQLKDHTTNVNCTEESCNNVISPIGPMTTKDSANEDCNSVEYESSKAKQQGSNNEDVVDPDTVCGIGPFKPQWLQPWATARTYMILYSVSGVLLGIYYTYFIGILSTLEKRYAFKSKISGSIMMLDEITPLALGIPIGYFGDRTHRPRLMGIGMLLAVLSCFVSALPYFIYGTTDHLMSVTVRNETTNDFCDDVTRMENCDEEDSSPTLVAVGCLYIGSFLKGFGNIAYCSVGLAYMDDTAKKRNFPIYFAVSSCLRFVGPVIGFLLASAFLQYYENPLVDPGYGPDDPRWIGGWWIGFLFQGVILLLAILPFFLFPKRLPNQKQVVTKASSSDQESLLQVLTGLWKAVKRLLKNPLYVWFCIATILSINDGFGYYIMLPKYMENQFHISASDANLISGPPGIMALAIATLAGAVVIWKWMPSAKLLVIGATATQAIAAVAYMALMLPYCSNNLAGTTLVDGQLQLQNECNLKCNCTVTVFMPVCGPDGISTYFSPCHAGCSSSISIDGVEHFRNCSCAENMSGSFSPNSSVAKGFCPEEGCSTQKTIFVVGLLVLSFLTSFLYVAYPMLLFRSVDPEDKSACIGMFEAVLSLFAYIPFPVIFGALVDYVCLVWEKSCGETGNCWFYDMDQFRYLLHGVSTAFAVAAVLCFFVVYYYSDRIRELYKDDDNNFSKVELKQVKEEGRKSETIK